LNFYLFFFIYLFSSSFFFFFFFQAEDGIRDRTVTGVQTCALPISSPQPSQFNMNFGNPSVDFQDHQVFAFLQDQLRLLPNLSVMAGLRYEFQPAVSHYQNLAPRLAVAYSPGGTNRILSNTVFRGGFGIFYDRQPYLMQQDGLLYDGSAIRGIVLSCPLS